MTNVRGQSGASPYDAAATEEASGDAAVGGAVEGQGRRTARTLISIT